MLMPYNTTAAAGVQTMSIVIPDGEAALRQAEEVGLATGAPQVQDAVTAMGDIQLPGACVERLGLCQVGHEKGHAAQALDPRGTHEVVSFIVRFALRPRNLSALRCTRAATVSASKPADSIRCTGVRSWKLKG